MVVLPAVGQAAPRAVPEQVTVLQDRPSAAGSVSTELLAAAGPELPTDWHISGGAACQQAGDSVAIVRQFLRRSLYRMLFKCWGGSVVFDFL